MFLCPSWSVEEKFKIGCGGSTYPSYYRGRDQKDHGSRIVWTKA
jgi:hypothetical protein